MRHVITRYAKANNKCMRYHDKDKESSYLTYGDVNYMYGQFLKTLPVNKFKCVKKPEQFNKTKIQNYNEKSKGYFLELPLIIINIYKDNRMIYHFFLKGWRLTNFKILSAINMIKISHVHQTPTKTSTTWWIKTKLKKCTKLFNLIKKHG